MATTTAPRTPPNGHTSNGFHLACWRVLSAATASGMPPASYLLAGEGVPGDTFELECFVCGDRWVIPAGSLWGPIVRRRLLALALDPAASGAA